MIQKSLTAALCLAVIGLAGCDKRNEMAANSKICADFKPAQNAQAAAPAPTVADAAAPLDDCVRRWAYSLAPSKDDAQTVAGAAVAACGTVLSRWNQQSLAQSAPSPDVQALSLTTGEPTNPIQEHNAFANGRALFYVVQARAGHCAPPPAANGAPTGLTG